MKVCLVATHGGHMSELLELLPAFEGYDLMLVTHPSSRDSELKRFGKTYFTPFGFTSIGLLSKIMFRNTILMWIFLGLSIIAIFPWTLYVLWRERPHVIISTGAEVALPFFFLGGLFRIRTIYLEGIARVVSASRTSKILYPLSDVFLVQWEELLHAFGPKAEYGGSVL